MIHLSSNELYMPFARVYRPLLGYHVTADKRGAPMSQTVFIGHDLTSDQPVTLSLKSRLGGLYLIGKQGMGKTNALLTLIFQDIHAGRGVCVFDPHGDLIVEILGA